MFRWLMLLSCLLVFPAHADVDLDDIRLLPGFSIEVYAEVPNARSLVLGNDGIVFVSNRRADSIYAIYPAPGGRNRVIEIDDELSTPNGIAYRDGDPYVAEISRVLVYRDIDKRLNNRPQPEVLDIELPSRSHHAWRYIDFGPDSKLYVSIGAPCNVCEEEGWLDGQETRGRPVDLLVLPDGSLLVSDDYDDKVYRIRYAGEPDE